MGKALKIIGILVLIFIAAAILLLKFLGSLPAVPDDYAKKAETGGPIEAEYMADGSYEVSVYEEAALQGFSKYTICYPTELETTKEKYPVIVVCNGSGTPISKYLSIPKHFASWGFIVIGTEEEYDWSGFSAEMCVRHLQKLNENAKIEDSENIFYQKVDFDNIGIIGHSQGGVGVLNAITGQKHAEIYKAAASLSPTNKELAQNLEWDYDAALVDIPVLLIAGAGGGDDWVVTGEQLQDIYSDIDRNKAMLRRKETAHGETLYAASGYTTAWFMWQLRGDEEAAKAFIGSAPEIFVNSLYQDQQAELTGE